MVRRVSKDWLAEGVHPALDHVFEHIGTKWPIDEREELFKVASYTAFPSNARMDAWRGCDQTLLTEKGEFYYPITVSLASKPNVWFMNLRLLQIRKKLNLITSLRVGMIHPTVLGGEALAKMKALEDVVGKHMMSPASVAQMQKPCVIARRTARMSVGNPRGESLRNAGLAARNNREQGN